MAKIGYAQLSDPTPNMGGQNQVMFLSLPDDGDEAIVRIMHDSLDDFDIATVHSIQLGKRFPNVNCLRDPMSPIDSCPFCAANIPVRQRIFIHMIQYTKDQNGNVVAEPKIWERTASYARTLKGYLENYGPLSDIICKIIRHGQKGDMNTTYEIIPNLSKTQYPDNVFVKNTEFFKEYSASTGGAIMNRNFDEMVYFVQNGDFPVRTSANASPEYTPKPEPKQWNGTQQAPATGTSAWSLTSTPAASEAPSSWAAPSAEPAKESWAAPAKPSPSAAPQPPNSSSWGATANTRPWERLANASVPKDLPF